MEQQIKEFETLTELLEDLEREGITGNQRKKLIDRFLMLQARKSGKPFNGGFELTPLCNFDCKMCYVHLSAEQLRKSGDILTTEEWLEIARQAADAGVMHIELTGGECLSHPGFKDIYLYLVSRGIKVSVLTNGQLLDEEMVALFSKYPPAVIQITLYGSCPEAYIHVTGRDAFDDVIHAIERVKAAGLKLKLAMMPSKYMQDDVDDLLALLRSLNVPYDISESMIQARPETERDIEEYNLELNRYAQILEKEHKYRAALSDQKVPIEKPYRFNLRGMGEANGLPCGGGTSAFHINWKGELTPCVPFYSVAMSVKNGRFEEARRWVWETVQSYSLPEECVHCEHGTICQACPAERTDGRWNGPVNRAICEKCNYICSLMNAGKAEGAEHTEE